MVAYLTIPVSQTLPTATSDQAHQVRIVRATPTAASALYVCRYNGSSWEWVELTLIDDPTLIALAAYNTTGIVVQTAADTFAGRTLAAPAAGFTITNPAGTAGNPTFVLANDLAAVEGLGSTGLAVRSAADTWVQRTITGTANEVEVTNGDGVSGNPTIGLPDDVTIGDDLTVTGDTTIGGALDHNGASVGFFGMAPAAQTAANADTSGATLGELETEVNELKAVLRLYGLLAT